MRLVARHTASDHAVTPGSGGHFSFVAELGETYDLVIDGADRTAHVEVALDASVPNITGLQVMLR